jgi:glutathione S-transferase
LEGVGRLIKLYGVAISNYFSATKAAFIEKQIPFEEIKVFPSQKPEVLAESHMGKVPWIDVDGEILTELNVIFDYLEDSQLKFPMYPSDPFERAKVKELIRIVELYIDAPARRHVGATYFGAPVEPAAFKEVRSVVENGLRALLKVAKFDQYIAGENFTFADIAAYFHINFAQMNMVKIYDWDMISDTAPLADYLQLVGQRPSVKETNRIMQLEFSKMAS